VIGARWNDLSVTAESGGPPPSFHYEYSDDWAMWVLDHGLPAMPHVLGDDDQIPIAYWKGHRLGTVLFRSWASQVDDDLGFVEERDVDDDNYSWVLIEGNWVPIGAGGGAGGPMPNPLARPALAADAAYFGGDWAQGDSKGSVRGVTGAVGEGARCIELEDRDGITRRPVEAPLGAIIVCWDADDEVTVRVLDAEDKVLSETRIHPDQW
jgi:hypothetical protein